MYRISSFPIRIRRLFALASFALLAPLVVADTASAQKPPINKVPTNAPKLAPAPAPTPTPTPPPAPPPQNLTPVGPRANTVGPIIPPNAPTISVANAVNGIGVGSSFSSVDAKCKEAGVRCLRAVRKINASVSLDRVRIDFPSGEFTRAWVTAKGGTILAVKGHYRTPDKSRTRNATKSLGQGSERRGAIAWAPASANGVVTEIDARGTSIRYIDTKAANAKSIAVNPALFTATAVRLDSTRPFSANSLAPAHVIRNAANLGGKLSNLQMEETPTPQVTNPLKIPVKFIFDDLKCFEEQDLTSWFHGDDPYLKFVGTHTGPFPMTWIKTKKYSDVESGNNLKINLTAFDADERRFVTMGEAVGVQFTLLEEDVTIDDEIDYGYPIIDYQFAVANQNKTLTFVEKMTGDGGSYEVWYRVEIGAGTPDPSAFNIQHVYRPLTGLSVQSYAGNYAGAIGDGASDGTLGFLASRDPLFPTGVLYGTLKDNGTIITLRTVRLQGDNVEMIAKYPSGSSGTLVGYLVGSGTDLRFVGTITRDGVSRGVALKKK